MASLLAPTFRATEPLGLLSASRFAAAVAMGGSFAGARLEVAAEATGLPATARRVLDAASFFLGFLDFRAPAAIAELSALQTYRNEDRMTLRSTGTAPAAATTCLS